MEAVAYVKRKGEEIITSRYSAEDAKVAGLWGKSGPWSQHPKRMLTMKARNFALRAAFADLFLGLEYSAEELQEVADSKSASAQVNHPRDVTPTITTAEISDIINVAHDNSPLYRIGDELLNGMVLSALIASKIDAIADKHDLEVYEIWREGNSDGIKEFCKFNKNICLDFKDDMDRKRHEVLSAE
jgi:hypothetical protein